MSRRLERDEWQAYCNRISKSVAGKRAELEVISLDLGDQIEAEWLLLYGIVYDPKADVFEVALEGLDHLISHPREVYVDEGPSGLTALEVIDEDETRQIVKLKEPLMLPGPSG
jgi:hypothetical protein